MASLNNNPFSSSKAAHSRLVLAAKKRGIDLDELRRMIGGSVRRLSARQCSDWITRLSGDPLPHPPGQAPRVRCGRPEPGITRLIIQAQIEQIHRLMLDYFDGDAATAFAWLRKDFKVRYVTRRGDGFDIIRQLATAKRGGEVIAALKGMVARKRGKQRP